MTPAQIKFAQNSIKSLKNRPESPAFQAPVNPVALGIPHYTQIITSPMDLGTIDIKLALTAAASKGGKPTEKTKQAAAWGLDPAKDVYTSVEQWEGDVRLVFTNCIRFNGPDHPVSASAKALEAVFERHMKTLPIEVAPPLPEPVVDDKKARRPSNPVPTIRRLSSDLSGRPKREIHPPPPRDLPYADEPQSSSGGKKRKSGKPLTAREQQYYAKVNQDELKYCLKVIDDFLTKASNQHFMWVFNDLPAKDMDFAPAYYQLIKRPICLNQIQGRLRKREYADKNDFVADMKLLFNNCYTFNPPDNEVHQMGKRTEAVFEEKMSNMPKAKPLSPEPDMEDEEDEEDAEAEAAKLAQIRELEEKLAEMKREAKLGSAKASGSGGKAGGPKKKASSSAVGEGKKKSASKPRTSSAGGASVDGQPKKPKQSKKKAASGSKGGAGSDDEDDVRVVTYEQKEELARKITQLSEERLDGALQIISEDKPASANDDEEIELDIDDLSPRTLYRLYRYVVKPKKKPGPKPGTAKAGSGKGVGGKKRKNLDEEAEAARIAALQEQLNSFERANSGAGAGSAPAASAAAPIAGGHDDLVQSESSSGEEDSDGSESDY
ncbi:Bromodomain-containing protein [Microstroma glucosiphilum]|uniref:Bromodomain-containing protein n=1 Tax=Pseudomicrostroma glucosiphilum TaxID=1684307 RepID=A0A316UG59_9BASI|nr:Bromodomain-containing protein [Pseudomicrostroma glucosiphilum]PWN22135.1 Bromodomain-containing protein [Pseudomicrostroma glucosiphilum]